MRIRDLRWDDFPDIVEAYWALYDEMKEDPELGLSLFPDRPSLGEEAEWFAGKFRAIQEGRTIAAVAEEDGHFVGMCEVSAGVHTEGRHVGVLGISVARAYRGKGIGRALMENVIERCKGRLEILELTVFATNQRARALYESLGFRTWGISPRAIRRGDRYIDRVCMQLVLGPVPAPP